MNRRRLFLRQPGSRARGFTIVEVMTVMAILGVMLMLAVPAMNELITVQRVKSASYDLNADLTYARAEAISRGGDVVVTSNSNSTDWQPGWTITHTDASGVTTTLRTGDARGTDLTFTGPGATVTFDRTGRATAAATVQFSIVPVKSSMGDQYKRCLRLDPSGRVRTALGACP